VSKKQFRTVYYNANTCGRGMECGNRMVTWPMTSRDPEETKAEATQMDE